MPYKVQSSEKLRKSGADFETKAMLYLLNFREDSSQINYFVVDFFNDITGMDRMARKLWDVQSKALKTGSAKTIGRELVTLYKNHVSEVDFFKYIRIYNGHFAVIGYLARFNKQRENADFYIVRKGGIDKLIS